MSKSSKKIEKYSVVEIVWIDSVHSSGWRWEKSQTFGSKKEITHKTVGYLLDQNKQTTVVTQSMKIKIEEDGDRCIDAVMEIPNVAIVSIKKIYG